LTLHRRDLFDARFQLISEDNGDLPEQPKMLDFIDNPSDLVPGIYEGGLKTWECSLDLVDYLEGLQDPELRDVRGKRVLEVSHNRSQQHQPPCSFLLQLGCGTAVPSLYLLQQIFSSDEMKTGTETNIHLQDYNSSVLELITLPNILLTWCEPFLPTI
jgi:protein-histidine N-methyltransferase